MGIIKSTIGMNKETQNLYSAYRMDDPELFEKLMDCPNVDLTFNENTPLCWACDRGHMKILEKLLKVPGINMNTTNGYSFRIAVNNGNVRIYNFL